MPGRGRKGAGAYSRKVITGTREYPPVFCSAAIVSWSAAIAESAPEYPVEMTRPLRLTGLEAALGPTNLYFWPLLLLASIAGTIWSGWPGAFRWVVPFSIVGWVVSSLAEGVL